MTYKGIYAEKENGGYVFQHYGTLYEAPTPAVVREMIDRLDKEQEAYTMAAG